MARAKKVDHKAVEQYAEQYPEATQSDIGRHFGIAQKSVSRILIRVGLTNKHRGIMRPATPPKGTKAEIQYFHWDRLLQRLGFGMSRAEKLGRHRLFPYDQQRQHIQDGSVTLPEELDDYDHTIEAFNQPALEDTLDESEESIEPLNREPMLSLLVSESNDFEDACL
jgi:hypothetical protein